MSADDSLREERIRDYLDGRLTGDALEAFELALFRDAALLDDVEATRALRTGLRTLAAQAANDAPPAPAARPNAALRLLPLAASFVLGATLPAYLLLRQPQLPDDNGKVQMLAVETLRGRPQTPVLPVAADAARVVLQFRAIPTPEALDYAVELRRGETLVQRVTGLVPSEDDQISIDVPAARLDAGAYTAKITARLAGGAVRDYATVDFALKK